MNIMTVGDNLKNNDCTFEQRQRDIEMLEKAEAEAKKRERHNPYKEFAQCNMDSEIGKARRELVRVCPSAYMIFDFLLENADNYNAVICSPQVFMDALRLSETTVYRAINVLKEFNFVDVKKSGGSNVYLLNKELVWKSWGTNYKYAKFGAKVIIAESEQDENVKVKAKCMNVMEIANK